MAAIDYSKILTGVAGVMADAGRSFTLTSYATTASPSTSSATLTPTTQTATGIETDYKTAQIPEALVKTSDVIYLVSASGLTEPSAGNKLTDGARSGRVEYVTRIKPGDTALLFGLLVRY